MDKLKEFFSVNESHLNRDKFIILLIFTYLFAIACRYIWVDWASEFPYFFWNNQLMINTNDGYFWAEGARDILAGFHQKGDLSPIDAPISILTAWLIKYTPFSLETVILWMSAIFGSLIVVPIMLIARALKLDLVGFFGAMLAGIAWSYYNRTMVGYYDTDMLTIVFPTFILYGLIQSILTKKNRWMLFSAILMVLYRWWYASGIPLELSFIGVTLFYILIWERRELFGYKLLIFMTVALFPLNEWIDILLIVALFLLFHFKKELDNKKILFSILAIAISILALLGGLNPILSHIKGYIFREAISDSSGFHFIPIATTVREAGKIPFEIFANRISGHQITFILSLIGYIILSLRYRLLWLALPMVGLGFLAMKAGLRFTVYSVPPMALGMGYLSLWASQRLATIISKENSKKISLGIFLLALVAVLYPNIKHIVYYRVPVVFTSNEVATLDKLKHIASREDYVLSWWDYGYPIRFYSDTKTLVDGGKHSGAVNYPVSLALTSPLNESANIARLDVEYTEKAMENNLSEDYISLMMRDYKISEPQLFLNALKNPNLPLPKKSRDIYYYLPYRMMDIYPVVEQFSKIDLKTGKRYKTSMMAIFDKFSGNKDMIIFSQSQYLNLKNGVITAGNQQVQINKFIVTAYDKNGVLKRQEKVYNLNSKYFVIYMQGYKKILLLDKNSFNSAYIQLFVLENYDPKLFKPVILTPMAKIYKLRK